MLTEIMYVAGAAVLPLALIIIGARGLGNNENADPKTSKGMVIVGVVLLIAVNAYLLRTEKQNSARLRAESDFESYDEGYEDGWDACWEEAYWEGVDDGYEAGYDDCYEEYEEYIE